MLTALRREEGIEMRVLESHASSLKSVSTPAMGMPARKLDTIFGSPASIIVEGTGFRPASTKSAATISDRSFEDDDWVRISSKADSAVSLAPQSSAPVYETEDPSGESGSKPAGKVTLSEESSTSYCVTSTAENLADIASKPLEASRSYKNDDLLKLTLLPDLAANLSPAITSSPWITGVVGDNIPSLEKNDHHQSDFGLPSKNVDVSATNRELAICGSPFDNFEDSGYMSNDGNEASMLMLPISRPETPLPKHAASKNSVSKDSAPETTNGSPPKSVTSSRWLEQPPSPSSTAKPKSIWQEFCELNVNDDFKRAVETSPMKNVSRRLSSPEIPITTASKLGKDCYLLKQYQYRRPIPTKTKPMTTGAPELSSPELLSMSEIMEIHSRAGSCARPAVSTSSAQMSDIISTYSSCPNCPLIGGPGLGPSFQMSTVVEIFSTSDFLLFDSPPSNAMSNIEEIYSRPPVWLSDSLPKISPVTMSKIVGIYYTPGNCYFDNTHEPFKEQKALVKDTPPKLEDAPRCNSCVKDAASEGMLDVFLASLLLVGIWVAVVALLFKLMERP